MSSKWNEVQIKKEKKKTEQLPCAPLLSFELSSGERGLR